MAVLHTWRLDHRKGTLDPAQHLDARAVHQQPHLRVHPEQAVHVVVGLVRDVAQAVTVAVPAEIVTPVVATSVLRPFLGAGRDVLDLLLISDEGFIKLLLLLFAAFAPSAFNLSLTPSPKSFPSIAYSKLSTSGARWS